SRPVGLHIRINRHIKGIGTASGKGGILLFRKVDAEVSSGFWGIMLPASPQTAYGSEHEDYPFDQDGLYPPEFHSSQLRSACSSSISSPFLIVAPLAFPRLRNSVSEGLYTRSYSRCRSL